jgi:hypothetical protein
MALPGRTRSFGLSSNKMTRHGIVCVSSAPFRPSGAAYTDALDLSSRLLITRRGSVTNPLNLDLRARAELLTYLVASHLFARRMTGDWLSSDLVVDVDKDMACDKRWGRRSATARDAFESARHVAEQIASTHPITFDILSRLQPFAVISRASCGYMAASWDAWAPSRPMFCENLRLDFRSTVRKRSLPALPE